MRAAAVGARAGGDGRERVDLIARAGFGAALVILLVYAQVWVAPLVGYSLAPEESGLVRNGYFVAYAAGLVLMLREPWREAAALLRTPLLALILVWALASVLWSTAPDATFRRAVALGFTTLAGVSLAVRFDWRRLAEVFALAFAVMAVITLALGLLAPGWGRMSDIFPGAWRGPWLEKNAMGGMMATGFALCAAAAVLNPVRRRLWSAFAALCVLLVLVSTSKTSLVALVLCAGAMGVLWCLRRGPAAAVLTVWACVTVAAGAAAVLAFAPELLFDALGKDATLTGRTGLWDAAVRQAELRPWLGWGYGVVWDREGVWTPTAWIAHDAGFKAGHAHNGWLEVWLGLGLVGLALWSLWLLEVLARLAARAGVEPGLYVAVPVVLVTLMTSLTEVSVLDYHDVAWTLFVAVAVKIALPAEGREGRHARSRS